MKRTNDNRISIGTSGWTYDGWRGSLYPEALRKSDWLPFYASRFRTVEINGSFYRTPSLEAVQAWHDRTPKNFHFAWKASKFITHWKRLSDKCENSIVLMESRLRVLERKISVVLFQYCFSFCPIFWKMRNGSAPFSPCCPVVTSMLLNSDIEAGTSIEC